MKAKIKNRVYAFLVLLIMIGMILGASPPLVYANGGSEPWWDYAYALKATDSIGDTQGWSTNATMCAIGNTSETNAEFDPARDLTAFWLTYDNETVYFRIYVNDLVSNDSLQLGAMYQVHFDMAVGTGTRDSQKDGRTWTDSDAAWERSVAVSYGGLMGQDVLMAAIINTNWNELDDSNPDPHTISSLVYGRGNMTVDMNLTGNYVEVSLPWEDVMMVPGEIPENIRLTVMSFKPGEWNTLFSPAYRLAFDPGDPGEWGREWQINDPHPVWGPDAADVMPGAQNEIDWDGCWSSMSGNWETLLCNTVDDYYTVQVLIPSGPEADFTYSPAKPHEGWTVTFNASASSPGWNGTHVTPITNYTWNFGDGNITWTAQTLINHTYTTQGYYNVTLKVTDTQPLSHAQTQVVRIYPITPYGPTASFTYSPSAPSVTWTVGFNALSSEPGWNGTHDNPIVSYKWDFGDGSNGTGSTTTHVYNAEGDFTVTLNVTDTLGRWNVTSALISVSPLSGQGYVHVSSKDPRYFEFDDGTTFFPIGINNGWILTQDTSRGDGYEGVGDTNHTGWNASRYFQEMKAHNINFVRIWMCSWHLDIEKVLGVYDESECARLDYLLELAEEYDIYIMLTLLTFTDYTLSGAHVEHWNGNPYNAANGGPCATPSDFFTDSTAKYYIKKRFNYILSRWGSNRRIAMWELWNEVNIVTGFSEANAKTWHEEVADVFRQNDTFRRPLATSVVIWGGGSGPWFTTLLSSNAIDSIQMHTYRQDWDDVAIAKENADIVKAYHNAGYNKPVMVSEYGSRTRSVEPDHCSNGVWAAVASGSAGSSMRWASNIFDDYGDMTDDMFDRYLYFQQLVEGIPWNALNVTLGTGNITGASNTRVFNVQGNGFAFAWVQHTTAGTVSGANLSFTGLFNDEYTVYVYDDSNGTYLDQYNVTVTDGNLTISLPDFTAHLAVKVKRTIVNVPEDFSTIQEGIDVAHWNDTVSIKPQSVYYEHVKVNRPLKLVGENRSTTIIDGNGTGKVVYITADNVEITEFTVQNSGNGTWDGGIILSETQNNVISANIIRNNTRGIYLLNSSNNRIYHNSFLNNTAHVLELSSNTWDDGMGKGNYWDDYAGEDQDGDSVGDTLLPHLEVDNYPLMSPWIQVHDVAVTNISPSVTEAYTTWVSSLKIYVTVKNWGDFTENFAVNLYYDNGTTVLIQTKSVTNLTSGSTTTVTFSWNLGSLKVDQYTIATNVSSVPSEIFTSDNEQVDGTIAVKHPGDANGDGFVGGYDATMVGIYWWSSVPKP